ncbi:alkaline phosphatase family protein [Sphingomicrobium clamense]|uniref:Alkaline phosphatase n=1 Tax=Sphingomicrobium clamense TaxID=2851013 RepID=A0ABS6V6Y4_9SPHN|nr:alkaline phosphatase family protein [Sphingomicrobium sp. B8]MBW0145256.1 alkaline phosphatase family protein [Sphingomicrobium sp. B8]
MRIVRSGLLGISMAALVACASDPGPAPRPVAAAPVQPMGKPDLLVVISVDQLSSDLFEAYAPHMSGGLARLAQGTAFLNGFQAQAATETCPGHSTILTGSHPARTGIVANDWYDPDAARENKEIYCAEDATLSDGNPYTVSAEHLLVPTLGERMKADDPRSRNVAVAGKDRSAVMMAGRDVDQRWYWGGEDFVTDTGAAPSATVAKINEATRALVARGIPALELPAHCADWDRAYTVGTRGTVVGTGRLEIAPGDASNFRRHPAYDGAALALAAGLIGEMQLGRGEAPDILSIGLAATDYVGHAYGNRGAEMCLQMAGLDRSLGDFLTRLDDSDLDYAVVLTADHGVLDVPPRLRAMGQEDASYVNMPEEFVARLEALKAQFEVERPVAYGGASGDQYLDPATYSTHGEAFRAAVMDLYRAHPQVAHVYTVEQIMAQPIPGGDPARWSMLQRVRASTHPDRSGDFYVMLKDQVMPIVNPGGTYTATHGSAHDYDRRVPILFWRKGMTSIARPDSAMTVDIMPTLAAMIGLDVDANAIDGKCLGGVPGADC